MKLLTLVLFFSYQVLLLNCLINSDKMLNKRALQKSHEQSRIEKLSNYFINKQSFHTDELLIQLLLRISEEYLSDCTTVLLYDNKTEENEKSFLEELFIHFPGTFIHGQITTTYKIKENSLIDNDIVCLNYILFLDDIMMTKEVIGLRKEKVIVVTKSSQWRVFDFLSDPVSQSNANLLVIVNSFSAIVLKKEPSYVLYTNELYSDALGSSRPVVLTSFLKRGFTRRVNLFPKKMKDGFSGHRFIVSMGEQPPFVIKKFNDNGEGEYDGIEIRLIELLAKIYNFTTEYREAPDIRTLGSGEAVVKAVKKNNVNLGIAGIYISLDRVSEVGFFPWHSQDCASFISLASTALPRYRAIMGPFHWTVWLALTSVYMLAIFLFSWSDKLTLRHLLETPEELENMFWYVYGTFTNCFTFSGKAAWSKADKVTTKVLVGFYWLFTIIVTACYTGSIIAFVTLPVFPEVVDYVDQFLNKHFQIGALDKGGWQSWIENITDDKSKKLLRKVDYVPDVIQGLKNVTKAFFWPYALLGSREQLDYIVRTNFTIGNKRSILHISSQCFMPFNVGIAFPEHSIYQDILTEGTLLAIQSGFMEKIKRDVEWDMLRTATGKLLPANAVRGSLRGLSYEDRSLNLDDTQGMFLLLAVGYLAGGTALLTEWFGGCLKCFKRKTRLSGVTTCSSIESNPRLHEGQNKLLMDAYRRKAVRRLSKKRSSLENMQDGMYSHTVRQRNASSNSASDVDLNEEINKIFSHVFEDEDQSSQGNDQDSKINKNVQEDTTFKYVE